ncbi:MAG TPA: carbon storage regulator [Gemmatimonadales bacterium]|nr:carbon storage regulator [Gemmatimonadales bacterium]
MLILNRRLGDAILMDGGIRVVILSCDRGGVRLGIEAPADTAVLREELVRNLPAAARHTLPAAPRRRGAVPGDRERRERRSANSE